MDIKQPSQNQSEDDINSTNNMMRSSQKIWNTTFTQLFQCRLPLLSAPMAGVSGGRLASEVTKAGGLGMIAAGHFQDVAKLEREIEIFIEEDRSTADNNLAIGFIGFSSLATSKGWDNYEYILAKYRPKAIQFFAPSICTNKDGDGESNNVQLAHKYNAKFIAQVGSINEAKQAMQHNVDAIICQGSEAGGHGLHRDLGNSTISLSSQVSNLIQTNEKTIPILAAGGIVTGKQLASALCVCDGASIGTRFWASKESLGNVKLQQELIRNNSCDDVIRTTVFDQIQNELSTIEWPYPYSSVGAIRNQTTEKWDGKSTDLLQNAVEGFVSWCPKFLDEYKASQKDSDPNVVPTLSGEGVGEIYSIDGAYDLTLRIEQEAIDTIDRLKTIIS